MDIELIWDALNSNVGTLILGSGIGWMFLNFVWNPWKRRSDALARKITVKCEAEFRLLTVQAEIGEVPTSMRIDGGTHSRSLDPAFQAWSLYGLIFVGWGKSTYLTAVPLVNSIKLDAESDRRDPQKVESAQAALQQLKSVLGLNTTKG